MKITSVGFEHETSHTTRCVFKIKDTTPILISTHAVRELQPERVEITVIDGRIKRCVVYGPSIIKAGHGAEWHRSFWPHEDRPDWVVGLELQAWDAYRAEHVEPKAVEPVQVSAGLCDGDVTATYTIHDDGVHLECQACGWIKPLGFDPPVRRMGQEAQHKAVST